MNYWDVTIAFCKNFLLKMYCEMQFSNASLLPTILSLNLET